LLAPQRTESPSPDGQQAGKEESGSKLPHSKAGRRPTGGLAQTLLFEVCDVPKGHANPFPQTIAARILEPRMLIYHRTYSPGELQFIATSTYRQVPVFLSTRFCHYFVPRYLLKNHRDMSF
jgi:hypothetical protein